MEYEWRPKTYQDYINQGGPRCPRCGWSEIFHKMNEDHPCYHPCIRAKPYKLADHTDLRIGMQVWHVPLLAMMPIKTGFVAQIWGLYGPGISLWKLPEDQTSTQLSCRHEGFVHPRSCFSTQEGAEARFNKLRRNRVSSNNIQADT